MVLLRMVEAKRARDMANASLERAIREMEEANRLVSNADVEYQAFCGDAGVHRNNIHRTGRPKYIMRHLSSISADDNSQEEHELLATAAAATPTSGGNHADDAISVTDDDDEATSSYNGNEEMIRRVRSLGSRSSDESTTTTATVVSTENTAAARHKGGSSSGGGPPIDSLLLLSVAAAESSKQAANDSPRSLKYNIETKRKRSAPTTTVAGMSLPQEHSVSPCRSSLVPKFQRRRQVHHHQPTPRQRRNGILRYPDGTFYDGEISTSNGLRDGYGTLYSPTSKTDNDRRPIPTYQGQWKDDHRHGTGRQWYLGGDVFHGDWVKDKRHGRGTYYWKNGRADVCRYNMHGIAGEGAQWSPCRRRAYLLVDGVEQGKIPTSVAAGIATDIGLDVPGKLGKVGK